MREQQHKTLKDIERQLDELTRMRYRGMIDDEVFIREKEILTTTIAKLKAQSENNLDQAETWAEISKKAFNFACHAQESFLSGDTQKKREIFSSLGRNYEVRDGKVLVYKHEWLIPIEKEYPELEARFNRLELGKTLETKGQNQELEDIRLVWGG
jgi:hypothetical protein